LRQKSFSAKKFCFCKKNFVLFSFIRNFAAMYEHLGLQDISFIMLYGGAAMLAVVGCSYLLLTPGNAFSSDIRPPKTLRGWAAAFMAFVALSHVWWVVLGIFWLHEDRLVRNAVAIMLDSVTLMPSMMAMLLRMLQDRKRPLWPIGLSMIPVVAVVIVCIFIHCGALEPILQAYLLALAVIFVIYYIRAVRQYGRWLLDNYADLERKEIWQSLVAITCILLMFVAYKVNYGGMLMEYVTQINTLLIIGFLLWRVETLQTLESSVPQTNTGALPMAIADHISTMLKERCEGKQLYLKHDLTLVELADAIETNRNYLSSYFAEQGTTYNNYINRLRIDHFISLYRETTEGNRSIAVLRLAERSGYKSYSTFSAAFKRITGLSETDWMKQCKK
jgi:AraC-like DNA-binding protein